MFRLVSLPLFKRTVRVLQTRPGGRASLHHVPSNRIVGPVEIRRAIDVCRKPANLRRTVRIAVVVGVLLTLINEGDVIVHGTASALTAVKVCLNFLVPFVVSNLGVLAGDRSRD